MSGVSHSTLSLLSDCQRILVVQPLVGIGDMLWHKPWIDELGARFKITLATKPTVKAPLIFHDMPDSFKHLDINRSLRNKTGRHDGFSGLFRLVVDFKKTGADVAIILHYSSRYALAARLAGIRMVFGYGKTRNSLLYSAGQGLSKQWRAKHAIDRVSEFAHLNGFGINSPVWRIKPSEEGISDARDLLLKAGFKKRATTSSQAPYLILGVGAMHPERQWGAENFTALAFALLKGQTHFRIMVMGGPDEIPLLAQIKAELDHLLSPQTRRHVAFFSASLPTAIALMHFSRGYIGNDTSFLNFSAMLGRPTIGLFSHSRPLNYSPHLISLDILGENEYATPNIIQKITPDNVLSHASSIWPEIDLEKTDENQKGNKNDSC